METNKINENLKSAREKRPSKDQKFILTPDFFTEIMEVRLEY